jgi:hypothetical protein
MSDDGKSFNFPRDVPEASLIIQPWKRRWSSPYVILPSHMSSVDKTHNGASEGHTGVSSLRAPNPS